MKLIVLLRAINVGGRVVKMEQLRSILVKEGFSGVETFIASGNVIVDGRASQATKAELAIERVLLRELGYTVSTFVRTDADIAAVAVHEPFPSASVANAATFCVGFLKAPLAAAAVERVMALRNGIDDFAVHGREVYWLSTAKQNESPFNKVPFERLIGGSVTFRGVNTVRKLAAKYPPAVPGKRKR